ncbi:MAG TPA: hypothetical protein VKQ29_16455 [Aliidongia sp.]|nr:hypothetical protein [Aliidongia sp.]
MVPKARSNSRGFALLIVLWALVLLALIVTELGTSGRMESKIARNLMANAEAETAADGAVHEAIFHLNNGPDPGWQADGGSRHMTVGPVPVDIRLEDEAGKVNPNVAGPDLLRSLLTVLGVDRNRTELITQAILDWRGGTPPEQEPNIAAQYQAAGKKYEPAFAPFESVEDIGLVLGMTPDLAARLLPHMTVNQIGIFDPARADPIVARALAQMPASAAPSAPGLPLAYRNITITATARTADGGRFTRRALVRIGPGLPRGYAVLVWDAPGTV